MAVAANEAAVKADIRNSRRGNELQLCGEEIGLGDAVFLVEKLQNIELHEVAALVASERHAADKNIEFLALDDLRSLALAHGAVKMREQVADNELRLALFVADRNSYLLAVRLDDNAVERKRDCRPLIFLYTAVVVSLEERNLAIFVHGVGLDIETGRVDMRRRDLDSVAQRACAENGEDNRLFFYIEPDLVARRILLRRVELLEAARLGELLRKRGYLALGSVVAEEGFVSLAPLKRRGNFIVAHSQRGVLRLSKQLFSELLRRIFFVLHFIFLLS